MIQDNIKHIVSQLPSNVSLVAVSKTKPVEDILEAYHAGQRIFGENKAQEMTNKYQQLPKDIQWHMIGHMQSNKVKFIAPFVTLIHSVDSNNLLQIINKEAEKNQRVIDCLLQVYIATEETKFGLDEKELDDICEAIKNDHFQYIKIRGLMGMASFSEDEGLVRKEFRRLKQIFENKKDTYFKENKEFAITSMGMSGDYKIAIEEGSTMVRIGSFIFGERIYKTNSSIE